MENARYGIRRIVLNLTRTFRPNRIDATDLGTKMSYALSAVLDDGTTFSVKHFGFRNTVFNGYSNCTSIYGPRIRTFLGEFTIRRWVPFTRY